ncbi:hypothetical protein SAMN05660350_00442 [Geodermatophilus obscurus]|uniref:Uncharacterized protein n=1 Tax=Geodermatophilus obscurus TaxID=1861 RepID=A0A1M7S3D9_9ACTN|nr:DUF6519 domain-containing protein [Geodermatophilus obscurus]SHN52941.1 hypothetical protein SAMN05660350_00442 [Geodermatophilus obscurus]
MYLDLSRSTFRPERGYAGVVTEQGRVTVDADANEALDIALDRERRTLGDLVGRCGVPDDGDAFRISAVDGDLLIHPGRIYVDGIAVEATTAPVRVTGTASEGLTVEHRQLDGRDLASCEWLLLTADGPPRPVRLRTAEGTTVTFDQELTDQERAAAEAGTATVRRSASYTRQPFAASLSMVVEPAGDCPRVELPDGAWLVYLEAWERSVTALEDPALLEPALGGADTSARRQVVWQVRLHQPATGEPAGAPLRQAPRGRLAARAVPTAVAPDDCTIPAAGGYRRLENQLYRVEIHRPVTADRPATFVWSRENGSVEARWVDVDAAHRLVVDSTGPDREHGFTPGDWVEVTDRGHELRGEPGVLVRLGQVEGSALSVELPEDQVPQLADFPDIPRLRRWEGPEQDVVPDVQIPLEDGIEIRFALEEGEELSNGDHWLIPARTVTADVEWPTAEGTPLLRRPVGPTRARGALAELQVADGAVVDIRDCRPTFRPLTDLRADHVGYVPDDGVLSGVDTVQEALDRLSRARNLVHHNRHLHGWGIVCGLRLSCDAEDPEGERRHALVEPGYALDRDGRDLDLEETLRVDARDLADRVPGALDDDASGSISLVLRRSAVGVEVAGAPHRPRRGLELLNGTIVGRFLTDCLYPLRDDVQAVLDELRESDGGPPGLARLRSSTTSLVAVLAAPASRGSVHLSRAEHIRLAALHQRLRARLHSRVSCGLLDGARPYPEYPAHLAAFDDRLQTVHTRPHSRIYWRPRTPHFVAIGGARGPVLHLYDAEADRMLFAVNVLSGADPATERASVRSPVAAVVFRGSNEVTVAVVQGEDTLLRTGRITGETVAWGELRTVCAVRITALAVDPQDPDRLWAVGVDRGLFHLARDEDESRPDPVVPFAAFGDLVVDARGRLYLSVRSEQRPDRFDRVAVVNRGPDPGTFMAEMIGMGRGGADGLTVIEDGDQLWLITVLDGDQPGRKQVTVFDPRTGGASGTTIPLAATTASLSTLPGNGAAVLTTEDNHGLYVLRVTFRGEPGATPLPTPAGPSSVVAVPGSARREPAVAVLSGLGGAVTVYPEQVLRNPPELPVDERVRYWRAASEAFADLSGAVAQHLKDCFFDQLIPDCPDDGSDGNGSDVVLGWVSFRGGQVDRVCNSSGRRYAGSFPTVARWLSIVPVGPLLGWAVEAAACYVVPRTYRSPEREPDTGPGAPMGRLRAVVLRGLLEQFERLDPSQLLVAVQRELGDVLGRAELEIETTQQPARRVSRRPFFRRRVIRRVIGRRKPDPALGVEELRREMRDRDRIIDELRAQLADVAEANRVILSRLGDEPS